MRKQFWKKNNINSFKFAGIIDGRDEQGVRLSRGHMCLDGKGRELFDGKHKRRIKTDLSFKVIMQPKNSSI